MDLSQSLEGAGGIGGLLARIEGTNTYYYTYDGNGNVQDVLNSSGSVVAHYEYDPFGKIISQTGPYAAANPWRFSTKLYDSTWDLILYEYRVYSPSLHIWLSRDPIEEEGGVNLFAFCANGPINGYDVVGLDYLDCLVACIEQNDPMNALIDSFIGRIVAKSALGSAGVPKSILAWIAELKGDKELADLIRASMKNGSDLGCKPLKVLLDWLGANRGKAAKAARTHGYVLAVYGTVLAAVEVDCSLHCICKDRYEGGNILNTKVAIDFYLDKLF